MLKYFNKILFFFIVVALVVVSAAFYKLSLSYSTKTHFPKTETSKNKNVAKPGDLEKIDSLLNLLNANMNNIDQALDDVPISLEPPLEIAFDKEIERRISNLKKSLIALQNLKPSEEKSFLISEVQKEIENLTSLKNKVDVKQMTSSYRTYAFYSPKIEELAASEKIDIVSDKLFTISAKLQKYNNPSLQVTFTDMGNKIADAKIQAQNAKNLILPLKKEGYPANKTALIKAKNILAAGRRDILIAIKDIEEIIKYP